MLSASEVTLWGFVSKPLFSDGYVLTLKAVTCATPYSLVSSAGEDENVVPARTTPFPDVIHITPAPGMYPGLTASPGGEEMSGGEVGTLPPLPIPPSVTDTYTKVTPVVREPGLDLTGIDAAMAPTGRRWIIIIFD